MRRTKSHMIEPVKSNGDPAPIGSVPVVQSDGSTDYQALPPPPIILIENGAGVPSGTAIGTLIAEKAV